MESAMATVALTAETFQKTIEKDGIVFVDYWASWCAPCRVFAPVYEKASEAHPDITWAKVDTDVERELAAALGIRSIPTLMVFRDGVLLFSEPGLLPAAALDELATKVRALDMEEIRSRLEAAKVA
jgi:thioredoxin 1